MKTKTTRKCPDCNSPLWLVEIGEYWDHYECSGCGHRFTTDGLKNPYGRSDQSLSRSGKCTS